MQKKKRGEKKMPYSFAITPSELKAVRQASSNLNMSMSAYVRKALDYYQKQIESCQVVSPPNK